MAVMMEKRAVLRTVHVSKRTTSMSSVGTDAAAQRSPSLLKTGIVRFRGRDRQPGQGVNLTVITSPSATA